MIGELPTRLEANSFAPMLTEPRSEDAFRASAIRVAHQKNLEVDGPGIGIAYEGNEGKSAGHISRING